MNSKILLGVLAFMAIFCNAAQAVSTFGPIVKKDNPWMNPGEFNLSKKLTLTPENIKEIEGIENQIKIITVCLQDIQNILGENLQGKGSTNPLKAAGLADLQKLYSKLIKNYKDILVYFGSTDHYYLPLSPTEYNELCQFLILFANKAGLKISVSDARIENGNTQWGG